MLRRLFIEMLGGYATVDDAIEDIRQKELKERRTVLTMAVKRIFNTVGPDDILKPAADGQWMYKGAILSKGKVEMLMHEAAVLDKMLLWDILKQDILYQVNRKMYLLAENDLQVVTAKFWLYTFDTMKTRLESIAKGSALFNEKRR